MGNKRRCAHFAVTVKVSGPVTWKVTGASTLVLALLLLLAWYLV